ncbi:MAG: hypothetical protein ABL961_04145 [Vicinamibacterales bacterium]
MAQDTFRGVEWDGPVTTLNDAQGKGAKAPDNPIHGVGAPRDPCFGLYSLPRTRNIRHVSHSMPIARALERLVCGFDLHGQRK